mgnify:CR=1 FL=1
MLAGQSPFKAALWLGNASPAAITQAGALGGGDLVGKRLTLDPGTIRKVWRDHSLDEAFAGQRPLIVLDFELLAHVWREPGVIRPGQRWGDLMFEKALLGRLTFVTWQTEGASVQLQNPLRENPAMKRRDNKKAGLNECWMRGPQHNVRDGAHSQPAGSIYARPAAASTGGAR